MGTAGIKIKIMPKSLEEDLEKIKKKARIISESNGGRNCRFEEEAVAFGLKAIIEFFELTEEIEPGKIEEELKTIKGVSSAQVIDMRRLI